MFRYSPTVKARIHRLRRGQTDTERKLWHHLRARQMNNAKFRRQYPIGQFIVDFCCPEYRLVVEVDGGHHASQAKKDLRRTAVIAQHGYHVLRFWDDEVLKNTETVLAAIASVMPNPHPAPLPERERENKNIGKVE